MLTEHPWDVPPPPPPLVRAVRCGCFGCRHIKWWQRTATDEWMPSSQLDLKHGASWRQLVIGHGPLFNATDALEEVETDTSDGRLVQLQADVLTHAKAWLQLADEFLGRRDSCTDQNKRRRFEDLAHAYRTVGEQMQRVGEAAGTQGVFPRQEGDLTILGPLVYVSTPEIRADTVITWQGVHFVPRVGSKTAQEHVVDAGGATVTIRVEPNANAMAGIGRNKHVQKS